MATALITELKAGALQSLTVWLQKSGIQLFSSVPAQKWYEEAKEHRPSLLFIDGRQALDDTGFIAKATEIKNHTVLILLAENNQMETLFSEFGSVIYALISYPINLATIALTVRNALLWLEQSIKENIHQSQYAWKEWLPGNSDTAEALRNRVLLLAPTNNNILITGDAGTGKRYLAELIHRSGKHSSKKAVYINCRQYPTVLLQSILFGHDVMTIGSGLKAAIDEAKGSSLILESIESLALTIQQRLNYCLQNTHPDVRVIATAGNTIYNQIEEGKFSQEFYSKISEAILHLPSLRDRPEDIPNLIYNLTELRCRQWHTPVKSYTQEAMQLLQKLPWTHNMVELKNSIDRLIIMAENPITPVHIQKHLNIGFDQLQSAINFYENKGTWESLKSDIEKGYIQFVLEKYEGNISKAATHLGVQRTWLYKKMELHNIQNRPNKE